MATRRADEGFMLLEVIVGLVIVTIIMTALTSLFVNGIQSTSRQKATQAAVRLVTEQADSLRALPAEVIAQRAQPRDITVNGADYHMSTTVDDCYQEVVGSGTASCGELAAIPAGASYVISQRITISVRWNESSCAADSCSYTDSIVVNHDRDPIFPFNNDPPPSPVLSGCRDQTVTIGQTVTLDLRGAQINCSVADGVSPFTWTVAALPAGLEVATNGLITGKVEGPAGSVSSTATVTDAFLRSDTDDFTWTVIKPLTEFHVRNLWLRIGHDTPVSVDLKNFLGDGASGVTYQLIAGQLPAGLSLDEASGVISGTHREKKAKDYEITIRATDVGGNSIDSTFMYYVRGNDPNRLLLCPTTPLPYDPPIHVTPDPPICLIPGYFDEEHSHDSGVAELHAGQTISFNLWDDVYGGTSPYRFVLDASAPAWIQVDPDTGVVTATPPPEAEGQEFKFLFQVYDANDFFYAKITAHWRVIQ